MLQSIKNLFLLQSSKMQSHHLRQSLKSHPSQNSTTLTQGIVHHYHYHYIIDQPKDDSEYESEKKLRRVKSFRENDKIWKGKVNPEVSAVYEQMKRKGNRQRRDERDQQLMKEQMRELLRQEITKEKLTFGRGYEDQSEEERSQAERRQYQQTYREREKAREDPTDRYSTTPSSKVAQTNRFARQNTRSYFLPQFSTSPDLPRDVPAAIYTSPQSVSFKAEEDDQKSHRIKLLLEECTYLRSTFLKHYEEKHPIGEEKKK